MEAQVSHPVVVTYKRDDASATLNLPDLDLLISAAGRQKVLNCALRGFGVCSGDLAHILGLLLRLVLDRSRLVPVLLRRLTAILELLLHLLDALLRCESRCDSCAAVVGPVTICVTACGR